MNSNKLRVVFAGTPDFAKIALQKLIDEQDNLNIKIVAVYTQPDRKAGRGQKLTSSPVKDLASQHGIAIEQPVSFSLNYNPDDGVSGAICRKTLANYRPDVMVVAAYGLILPLGVLNIPKFGCLNIHASLLPRFRGAAPIQRAILAADATTGITIMQMNQGLDTGDMLYKLECKITEQDTTQSLHDKLADLGGLAICHVLKNLDEYQSNKTSQDDNLANYAQKITNDEGKIDWQKDAFSINRQIRALNAYTFLNGERVKILAANPIKVEQSTNEPCGKVVSVGRKAILVACGDGCDGVQHLINITAMQWAGGKPLTAEQIANANKIKDGDMFAHE